MLWLQGIGKMLIEDDKINNDWLNYHEEVEKFR